MTAARLDQPFDPAAVQRFTFLDHHLDPSSGVLRCRYALDDLTFEERISVHAPAASRAHADAVGAAARLVFLLAGISYYKAAAPPVLDLGPHALTPAERALLAAFHRDGLGEYAYRNDLDLSEVEIVAEHREPLPAVPAAQPRRPLIPFGGGLDSIVTVEGVRDAAPDAALFVVSREGDRFEAIEVPAAATGLPVVRAERRLDDKILRSAQLGFRNGHIPVTGIISAIAVLAAVLDGRDAVVMSNEWSASSGNVERDGHVVNHQWSKSLEFEDLFRAALGESLPVPMAYYSWLRPWSELWVAARFEDLGEYHRRFRSCNRAFHIDPARRLDHWCGRCDKCAFIDLILSPYLPADELRGIFGGAEPLAADELRETFRALVGVSGEIKPFECVGDVDESRVAVLLAARRDDRAGDGLLHDLAREVAAVVPGDVDEHAARLARPLGPHRIPDEHAPQDLLG